MMPSYKKIKDAATGRRGDAATPSRPVALSPRRPLAASPHRRGSAGFSLMEMLVVMAVAAILLGLVVSPLVSTFNFTNRARRNVEVQDAARYAMELCSREISDAMHVVVSDGDYESFTYYVGSNGQSSTPGQGTPVVVRGQGYLNAYDDKGKVFRLPNAMIDVILPHDELGLEGGGIQQPLAPQHQTDDKGVQHPIVVRYFVGLTHPERQDGSGKPIWQNNNVSRFVRPQNMYTLYRVEFDPYDPQFSNWAIPDPNGSTTPDGRQVYVLNPDFFYEMPQAVNWRKHAVAIMPTDTMDLVDFVPAPGETPGTQKTNYVEARSLITFNPLIAPADAATAQGDERQPSTYKTQYGHWTGLQNDGTVTTDGGGFLKNNPTALANLLPHIVVYDQQRDPNQNDAITLETEFDSWAPQDSAAYPGKRNRVLAWNSLKGTVEFSLPAPDFDGTVPSNGPTSIFDALSSLDGAPGGRPPGAYITPGSEAVQVEEVYGDGLRRLTTYSRAASATKDIYEVPEEIAIQNGAPQQLPPPRQYIVTNTGKVIIGYPYPSPDNPAASQPVPAGQRVVISYYYQNNNPDDLVKVDYMTREMVTINMTARMYDPVNRSPIVTTLANRVRLRNIQR